MAMTGLSGSGWRIVLAFACLMLAACTPPEPIIFQPANWTADESDEGAWVSVCAGAGMRTYRKVVEDSDKETIRLELETVNESGSTIMMEEKSSLASGEHHFTGKAFRLFSPEGNIVPDGERADFAIVFELQAPVNEVLGEGFEIEYAIKPESGDPVICRLRMDRI